MKVDIVLITYNQEQYVAQAIEGILLQHLPTDLEARLIVADDASTDRTLEIIHSYEEQSPFHFIYLPLEPHFGHVGNYRRAFNACDGDYACVLEGDDYWSSPFHIEKHVRFLESHSECSMSVNKITFLFQENNKFVERENLKEGEFCYVTATDHILQNRIDNHSSCCYRISLLHKIPCEIMTDIFSDWTLGIYMAENGYIAQLEDSTSVYRIHRGGIWSGDTLKNQYFQIMKEIDTADRLFEYRYHKEMEQFRQLVKIRTSSNSRRMVLGKRIKKKLKSIFHLLGSL